MSQSVDATMRCDRWCPMKPLTPRMSTRFMSRGLYERHGPAAEACDEFDRVERAAFDLEASHAQRAAAAAIGEQRTVLRAHACRAVRAGRRDPGGEHSCGGAGKRRERARIRRRHGADEVVDAGRALRPVDAAVLRRAAAEIRSA